ncbi:helix-turn-helix domain-containing protein [Oceanobacillus halophilus]|uniref:XRE family transcriptional regulator n=1 Tax=Oceanobacillus halophilus TaxID=930130 RepID=A0A495A2A4_9BACI|nr:helix-turn-helix transcriptional regulator [Oceanobacillus halophilus]RKQ33049.1 XRE family transcriptional regulator [Oceanobacillus halophilus]
MDSKRLGKRVKAFRKLKGYTQIDFARELDVSISTIGNVERGTKEVTDELLSQISSVLNIPKEEIVLHESTDGKRN